MPIRKLPVLKENNPLMLYIGGRLHNRRKKVGLTLSQFAEISGISHQQLHKYEKGKNGIPAHRLYELSQLLGVEVSYFYEGFKPLAHAIKDGLKILLVEDCPADAILMREALRQCGQHNAMEVLSDGREALDNLRRHQKICAHALPDIIFLDLHIPTLDGFAFLKAVKQDSRLRNIPIVIVTNSVNPADVAKCYQEHANGFLQKITNHDDFSRNLATTLNYWISMKTPNQSEAFPP